MYGRQDIFCDLRRFPACSSECQEPAPKQVVNTAQYLLVVSKGTYKSQGSTHVAVPTNTALVVDFITQLIRVANASIEPEKMTAFQTRVMCIHSSMKHGTTKTLTAMVTVMILVIAVAVLSLGMDLEGFPSAMS